MCDVMPANETSEGVWTTGEYLGQWAWPSEVQEKS